MENPLSETVFSEKQLDVIDVLVALSDPKFNGAPVLCENPNIETDLLNEELLSAGFISYAQLPDFHPRRLYERSLWVRRPDNRCVPELYALATLSFGTLPIPCDVYWTDRNPSNNQKDNITVRPKARLREGSKYGVRSGTPEYMKHYKSDPENQKRIREASRRYAQKQRAIIKRAKDALQSPEMQEDDLVEQLKRKLGFDDRKGDDDDSNRFGTRGPSCVACNDFGFIDVDGEQQICAVCNGTSVPKEESDE